MLETTYTAATEHIAITTGKQKLFKTNKIENETLFSMFMENKQKGASFKKVECHSRYTSF
jgi:beta-galactosidase beta subunit